MGVQGLTPFLQKIWQVSVGSFWQDTEHYLVQLFLKNSQIVFKTSAARGLSCKSEIRSIPMRLGLNYLVMEHL